MSVQEGPFKTLDEIREANKNIGHHWFDPETKVFFDSIWDEEVFGGRYFVSAEAYDATKTPHRWTIRRATNDGAIESIGLNGAYTRRSDAKRQAKLIAAAHLRVRPDREVYRPCDGANCKEKDPPNWAIFELPIAHGANGLGELCLELCPWCIPVAVDQFLRPLLDDKGELKLRSYPADVSDIKEDDGLAL